MMNLVSFETPPLRRQERVHATTTTTTPTGSKDASSRSTFFDGHLDLSLGMSTSRSGSGCCDATRCSGDKASEMRPGGNHSSNEVGCISGGVITTANPAITLSAGHGHVSDLKAGTGCWSSAFMPSPTGFMHPWSLAARQQKAVAEQERTPAAGYVPSEACAIPLPPAVGWPPVHTSRRNLVTAMHTSKSDGTAGTVDGPKGAAMLAGNAKKNSTGVAETQPPLAKNMFAKVHMEGYAIARKINLRAHSTYDSLSRVLTKMTRNFFCPADCSTVNVVEEDFCTCEKFIFLYEDFEGDRMLVGDVPWELFIASAKRLYIVRNPVPGDKGHDDFEKHDTTEKATN